MSRQHNHNGTGGHAQHVEQVGPLTPDEVAASRRPVGPSAAMKFAIAVLVVSVVVNVLLIAHGVVQEFHLHRLKTGSSNKEVAMDVKEESLVSAKNEVALLKIAMETERTKTKELAKKYEEIENGRRESETKLQSCKSEKARN